MGFSQYVGKDSLEFDKKIKTLLRKMILHLGFSCVSPVTQRRRHSGEGRDSEALVNCGGEHNKAWLLAESGGCGGKEINSADPQSVHSSFRFTICSQVEVDSLNPSLSSSRTVLMVNLDSGLTDSRSRELKCRRIESLERNISPVANALIRFSFGEIASATRNFRKGQVLGTGASSCVFRGRVGILRTMVAIKRLDKEDTESARAFYRELMIASSLQHPNIVPLVGFCIHQEEGLFLVYKYVSGGSLESHLHDKMKRGVKGGSSLSLLVRYQIAIGVAEAISYLHNGTDRCVVHRDIKPSNILLSSKKTPKVCDFGLASWTSAPSVPFLCKTVKGTFGYLAPEYFQHGKVSDKTDVYAFGVVLLELITGRKAIEAKRPTREVNLVQWAKPLLQSCSNNESMKSLVDPRLKLNSRNSTQVTKMAQAAAACINNEESRRPNMNQIIAILRGDRGQQPISASRKSGCVIDCCPQLQHAKSDFKRQLSLSLAMHGVPDSEDDDHLFCR